MSHRHVACSSKQKNTKSKCDHIDCECSAHLSDSSEHVICKWDPADQPIPTQLSSLGPKLNAYSTASCIDTGGIRLSSVIAPSNEGKVDTAADGVRGQGVKQGQGTQRVTDKTVGQSDLERLKVRFKLVLC